MRKISTIILLLLMMSSACYGAVSEDMSVYVRKDVFDAKMEAFMAEIRLMNGQLQSEIRELGSRIDRVETRIDGVEKRMSSLETMIYWILATLSVSFAVLALAPYFKEIRKPSITLDEVKRLIEENNVKLERKFQV